MGTVSVTASVFQAVIDKLVATYTDSSSGEGAGVVSIQVIRQGGQVASVRVTPGFVGNAQTCACNAVATATVPACSGITVSTDGLTVLFNNTTVVGSLAVGNVVPTQVVSGNMVAKGR